MSKKGFTLIELLIVVAIIAILAAIAIPNFLQAQVRAKVSRVRAELRTIATGMESYYVDNNSYPHDFRSQRYIPPYNPTGLWALSTPIAYLTEPKLVDPFSAPDPDYIPPYGGFLYTYQALTDQIDSQWYSVQLFGNNPTEELLRTVSHWWVVFSSGPNTKIVWEHGYRPHDGAVDKDGNTFMYNVVLLGDEEIMRQAVYDPTNGVISFGNIYRVGGSTGNPVFGVIEASY